MTATFIDRSQTRLLYLLRRRSHGLVHIELALRRCVCVRGVCVDGGWRRGEDVESLDICGEGVVDDVTSFLIGNSPPLQGEGDASGRSG